MSTSDNKPDLPAETSDQPPASGSERAKAIARRSFLRKSAGIAAPVVMTLQSGPALAIRSITCADKTGNLDLSNKSGFTGSSVNNPDETSIIQNLEVFTQAPDNSATSQILNDPSTLTRVPTDGDGFVRCDASEVVKQPFGDTVMGSTFQQQDSAAGPWRFVGPIQPLNNPLGSNGPIAYFSIVDGEETFEGCFGDTNSPQTGTDINGDPFRALTCSCWGSLNP